MSADQEASQVPAITQERPETQICAQGREDAPMRGSNPLWDLSFTEKVTHSAALHKLSHALLGGLLDVLESAIDHIE